MVPPASEVPATNNLRWVFAIAVVLALIVAFIVLTRLPRDRPGDSGTGIEGYGTP